MNQEEKAFIIRAYDKAELAELYSPGRTAAAALQTLYRWMRRNMLLQEELNEAGYNKLPLYFLAKVKVKKEVICKSEYVHQIYFLFVLNLRQN